MVVDARHVFRAGTSLDELDAALPPEVIFGVEFDDAAPQACGELFEDTVERRLLCPAREALRQAATTTRNIL